MMLQLDLSSLPRRVSLLLPARIVVEQSSTEKLNKLQPEYFSANSANQLLKLAGEPAEHLPDLSRLAGTQIELATEFLCLLFTLASTF